MAEPCVFNEYVSCLPDSCGKCKTCGWNPLVEAKRKNKEKKHEK